MAYSVQYTPHLSTGSAPYFSTGEDAASWLYDQRGKRKYLTPKERDSFLSAIKNHALSTQATFCNTLAYTGGRISEILELTPRRIDVAGGAVVIRSLKKRGGRIAYRMVPIPLWLLQELERAHSIRAAQEDADRADEPIWAWSRTTAWSHVKEIMKEAGIVGPNATPKGLRHGFAIAALEAGVPITLLQRWLGHARLEMTAVYTQAVGQEERRLAERMWFPNGQ